MMDWNASWIWHPAGVSPDNLYLHARKVITLTDIPAGSRLYVTAGSLYKLWINGQYVGRGPNPADPSFYYYDVHDVTPFLRPGANVIALTCYSYGPKSHGIVIQNWGPGGLLLELKDSADKTLAGTDASWRIIQAPEWDQHSELNNTLYGDFKEFYDSRKEPAGWRDDPAFDDSAWHKPAVLGRPPEGPYPHLRQREIPFLTDSPLFPVDAHWESASVTYAWRDDWEFYHEHSLVPGSPLDKGDKPMDVRKTHADFTPSVLFDFGRLVTGYLEISVKDSAGGIVDVLYGEELHLVRIDRFTLKGGPQVLRPFGRRTFRYVKLLFPEVPGQLLVDRIQLNSSVYPADHSASAFACSDPLLNRIYETAKYTIQQSMLDHLVDCPGRERSIYGGDVYVESLFVLYAFGDPAIIRKTVRQNFAIQFPQGGLPVVGPYSGFDSFYPSWSAFVGLALLDDYRYTGSTRFVEEMWPGFARLMDFAIGQIQANNPHLIGEPAEGGGISKWLQGPRVRFVAWSNFPFYPMFRRGAEIARILGHEDQAQRYDKAADLMQVAIQQCFIGEDGLFSTFPRGKASAHGKAHDNGLLAWSGALDKTAAGHVVEELLKPDMPSSGGPFQDFFIAHDAFEHAGPDGAMDFVRRTWGDMIARGATTFWEHTDPTLPPGMKIGWGTSYCHGWSAGPVYLLPAYILGIRPLEPGFAKVLIAPESGSLTRAEGKVPTPHGEVAVRWVRTKSEFHLTTHTPAGCPATVSLPAGLGGQVTIDGAKGSGRLEGGRLTFEVTPGDHTFLCRGE